MKTALMLIIVTVLAGCAPTGDRTTIYYDADGRPTHTVQEEAYNGKYAEYRQLVVGLAEAFQAGKTEAIAALRELMKPIPGESKDLTAYKQGQLSVLLEKVAMAGPEEAIEVVHYGTDEHDTQQLLVKVGGDTFKFTAGVAGVWKLADTLAEKAGDTNIGEGGSFTSYELHGTGDGNIVTLDKSATEVFEPETVPITAGEVRAW